MTQQQLNDLIGTLVQFKKTKAKYRIYAVTDNRKALPADEPLVFLELVQSASKFFAVDQQLITIPSSKLLDFFLPADTK